MRKPDGFSITLSPFRRPTIETAPVDAKAGCLYPEQCARADRGQCARLRQLPGVRRASAMSPSSPPPMCSWARTAWCSRRSPNGTFLAGITRQRVIELLREAGVTVIENRAALRRLRKRRRDFLHRQCFQGAADHPHRRALVAARPALPQGARALLGLCAFVTHARPLIGLPSIMRCAPSSTEPRAQP